MTTKIMCSVFDIKGCFYSAPFTSINENTAARDFAIAVRDPESNVGKYPEDYRLFVVGEFDDVTGKITPLNKFLVDGLAFQEEK